MPQQEERVKNVKPAYDSKRANFDNSAMKRRYEQSVMKQRNAYAKTASESEIHDRDINKSKVRKKSKRQREKNLEIRGSHEEYRYKKRILYIV